MINRYITGVLIGSIMVISCGGSRHSKKPVALPGTWQPSPIAIDGDSKDWPSPYPNYDSKAMVAYATSNDKENLYITMETGDEITQVKILKQGMTVSIDTSGKKDPQFNINYPLQNDNDPLELPKGADKPTNQQALAMGSMLNKQIIKASQDANQFTLEGFGSCNGGFMVSQTSPCGIKVKVRMDEYNELVWEAVVPFKAIYNKDVITEAEMGKPISVCFAVKAFKKENKNTSDNSNGGMNQQSSGMGGRGGGMGGGGGGRGGGGKGGGRTAVENPMDHLYEKTKTWKVFGIAYQP